MTESRSPPLNEAQRGDTNLFGFVVTVNYSGGALGGPSFSGTPEEQIPKELKDQFSTYSHEAVHFIHALSTAYMYKLAMSLVRELQKCTREVRAVPQDKKILIPFAPMASLLQLYETLDARSTLPGMPEDTGVSARAVLEGAAVFITWRMHLRGIHHDALLARLEEDYGSGSSPYSRTYRFGASRLGENIFDVFSAICFLALCTDDPGRTYLSAIDLLVRHRFLERNPRPALSELKTFLTKEGLVGIRSIREEVSRSGQHPIIAPYLQKILSRYPEFPFTECIARPYECTDSEFFQLVLPPVVRHSDGTGIASPQLPNFVDPKPGKTAAQIRHTDIAFLFNMVAIGGTMTALAAAADYHMQCPYEDCPYHRLKVCTTVVPIPPRYQDCTYPSMFQSAFRRGLDTVDFA
jgi:hypothetical protein